MTDNTDENGTGHLRPDAELNAVFKGVVRDLLDDEYGAVKRGANAALLDFLDAADDDAVRYNLTNKTEYETLDDLRQAVRDRQQGDFPGDEGGEDGD